MPGNLQTLLTATLSPPDHPPLSVIPCILSFFNSSVRVFSPLCHFSVRPAPTCWGKTSKGKFDWPSQLSEAEETGRRRPDLGDWSRLSCEQALSGNFGLPKYHQTGQSLSHFLETCRILSSGWVVRLKLTTPAPMEMFHFLRSLKNAVFICAKVVWNGTTLCKPYQMGVKLHIQWNELCIIVG